MKNIEVELRALIPELKVFEKTLEGKGATFTKSSYLCDIYFCRKDASSINEVEMHDVGSYSLRLRRAKKDDQEEITLNTKTITNKGDHHAWEEHEVVVNDFEEAARLLTRSEFKPFFKLEKTRRTYTYDEMEIAVEDITDFGGAVEVEIMTAPGEEDASKERIRTFLASVGIGADAIVPKSVTNIVMKERAFKQDIAF